MVIAGRNPKKIPYRNNFIKYRETSRFINMPFLLTLSGRKYFWQNKNDNIFKNHIKI
jgi:hypothetical protein